MTKNDLVIVADEDVDGGIIRVLREAGFNVRAIIEERRSDRDEEVLHFAIGLNALLLTQDKGFGRLVRRYGMPPQGVVLIRLVGWTSAGKAERVLEFFQSFNEQMSGLFAVVEPAGTRIARWP